MADSSGRPLLERLQERTATRVTQAKRGPMFNVPMGWYCKPNGDVVQLQSDAVNRMYYEDKGYTYLRPDEAREWESSVRPVVVAAQRERADLINMIRRIAAKHPTTEAMVGDMVGDETTVDELRAILVEIGEKTQTPVNAYLNRPRPKAEERETDPEVRGVEVAAAEDLQAKIQRGTPRAGGPRRDQMGTIEGTGYDPTTGRRP